MLTKVEWTKLLKMLTQIQKKLKTISNKITSNKEKQIKVIKQTKETHKSLQYKKLINKQPSGNSQMTTKEHCFLLIDN